VKRPYLIRRTTHVFVTLGRAKQSTVTIPWPVCKGCGLVLLKNPASQRAAREPCEIWEDTE
jgi:hypothetical protein